MTLPVLLSIPHGGTHTPPELQDILCISDRDIFEDGDAYTISIYDIGDAAAVVVRAEVARAFVDLNRSLQEMPPASPDGLVKSITCRNRPIYTVQPDEAMRRDLIAKYYMPYHRTIQQAVRGDLQLCLDCHSMAEVAPAISPDGGSRRPLFCLSNRRGQTSSNESMTLLASCISEAYGIPRTSVRLNDPFLGGYITRTYGNNPLPWIQVEMNRSMYISEEWFDHDTMECRQSRLRDLRLMFEEALRAYFRSV